MSVLNDCFFSPDLPREGPRITGNEQENRRGDSLFLNCTSGRSYPAAVLSWDIDGEKVLLNILNEKILTFTRQAMFSISVLIEVAFFIVYMTQIKTDLI